MLDLPTTDWANFFFAQVGASATLAGLLVVAISINLTRILAFQHLPAQAGGTLAVLTGVLILASIALMPKLPDPVFGMAAMIIGAAAIALATVNQLRFPVDRDNITSMQRYARSAIIMLASLPFVIGGLMLLMDLDSGLYWIAIGMISALVAGVLSTWILLVEILR
ncbi:MAG: hypothetical protein KGI75_11470 [Rhizobiaceae bacterium]|nr:hypothetical protein [Rhizobiaceae bacterium]